MSRHDGAPESPGKLLPGISKTPNASRALQKRYEALTGPVQRFRLSGEACPECGAQKACEGRCTRGTRARMVPVEEK